MSRRILIALLTAAAGCSNAGAPLDVGSREAALQQLACPGGVESTGPNLCMTVPPVNKPAPAPDAVWDPWIVDGVKTKTEYFGAIEFPYVHPGLKLGGGHVFVNMEQNLKTLHVFVQNALLLLYSQAAMPPAVARATPRPMSASVITAPAMVFRPSATFMRPLPERL